MKKRIEDMEDPGGTGNFFLILGAGIAFVFFLLLFLAILFFPRPGPRRQTPYPDNGTYYCQELDATIILVDRDVKYQMGDDAPMDLYIIHSGKFDGYTGGYISMEGKYTWDQEKDILKLEFEKYPQDIKLNKKYVFEPVG